MQLKTGCKGWPIVLPVIVIDRICKAAALNLLAGGAKTAIPGILSWELCRNTGAAFSFMAEHPAVMPLITAVLIAALLIYLLRHPKDAPLLRAGLWMILGGGLSNLFDRVLYGAVIDFIRTDFVRFAIFNPADVFVCVGAGLAVLAALFPNKKEEDRCAA